MGNKSNSRLKGHSSLGVKAMILLNISLCSENVHMYFSFDVTEIGLSVLK